MPDKFVRAATSDQSKQEAIAILNVASKASALLSFTFGGQVKKAASVFFGVVSGATNAAAKIMEDDGGGLATDIAIDVVGNTLRLPKPVADAVQESVEILQREEQKDPEDE